MPKRFFFLRNTVVLQYVILWALAKHLADTALGCGCVYHALSVLKELAAIREVKDVKKLLIK